MYDNGGRQHRRQISVDKIAGQQIVRATAAGRVKIDINVHRAGDHRLFFRFEWRHRNYNRAVAGRRFKAVAAKADPPCLVGRSFILRLGTTCKNSINYHRFVQFLQFFQGFIGKF